MNNIMDLLGKVPAIVEATVTCNRQVTMLYPLRDVVHNMQLVFYWLRDADRELRLLQQEEVLTTDWYTSNITIQTNPVSTITSVEQGLISIINQLKTLSTETQNYIDSAPLPSTVKCKLEQGYNKMMEASYNTEIAIVYYEEIKRSTPVERTGREL